MFGFWRMICGAAVAIFGLFGCAGLTGATPPQELEANSIKELKIYTKAPVEAAYGKVLDEKGVESVNDCVARNLVLKLTNEQKLFLGGNALEKAANAKEAKGVGEKATGNEMKEALAVCTAQIGVSKLLEKIR